MGGHLFKTRGGQRTRFVLCEKGRGSNSWNNGRAPEENIPANEWKSPDRKMDQKRKISTYCVPLQIRIADLFADCGRMIVVDEGFFEDPLSLNLSILEH